MKKENWLQEFRKWYKDNTLPAVAWSVSLEKIEGKINQLLRQEKEKLLKRIKELEKENEELKNELYDLNEQISLLEDEK